MIRWNQPLPWKNCFSSQSRQEALPARDLSKLCLRAEVKELHLGWSLTLLSRQRQQGYPARAPSSLSLLSCTHCQDGRVRRNTSTTDMGLNWETTRRSTRFLRRAVFNLEKSLSKCRSPSKEPHYQFSKFLILRSLHPKVQWTAA